MNLLILCKGHVTRVSKWMNRQTVMKNNQMGSQISITVQQMKLEEWILSKESLECLTLRWPRASLSSAPLYNHEAWLEYL
jgi:hypothetical protein